MIWTRRRFLGASAAALAATPFANLPAVGRDARTNFLELRRGVGTFSARGGTIGWLINDGGALVVDSQFADTARTCVEGLGERDALPVDALVNSHHHADHTGGNGVFRDVATRIVAHRRVPELLRRVAEANPTAPAPTLPDTTFEDAWSMEIGDEVVRARHYGPAHTGGDCTIFFERADIVHMGDLVFNRAYPFIDRPGGASVAGWISLLDRVAAEHGAGTLYIFGHAREGYGVTGTRADILEQRDFLAAAFEHARRAVSAGQSREEATALETLPGFADFAALSPRLTLGFVLGVAYAEITDGS